MSKFFSYQSTYAIASALFIASSASADDAFTPRELSPIIMVPEVAAKAVETPAPAVSAPVFASPVSKEPFKAFTGKIKGRKVRVRLKPDMDGYIIKELNKNDLISVVGEKDNFWAIEPPSGTKAYVFRSFVLDNMVEGNHVNIRLQPALEAPVLGQLNAGEKLHNSVVSAKNPKWLEIAIPSQFRFYVSKDFIEYAGGPDVKTKLDTRRHTAEQLLDSANLLSTSEMKKSYDEIDFERVVQSYKTIVNDYADFPEYVEHAKESLSTLQESYAQKRLSYQETLAVMPDEKHAKVVENFSLQIAKEATDKMKIWEPVEESLYLTWSCLNNDRSMDQFYDEQKISSVVLSGILEAYSAPIKNKPGDFIVREKDLPVAYVYSTKYNLQDLIGKKVTLRGAQRPNNNFAFPAYYVLSVE